MWSRICMLLEMNSLNNIFSGEYPLIFTAHKRSCGKVMCSQVSVILFCGVCMACPRQVPSGMGEWLCPRRRWLCPGGRYVLGGVGIPEGAGTPEGVDILEGAGIPGRWVYQGAGILEEGGWYTYPQTWELKYPPPQVLAPSSSHYNTHSWQSGVTFPTRMLSCSFLVLYSLSLKEHFLSLLSPTSMAHQFPKCSFLLNI